ncbi:PucR family transcriptional regulator [Tsukamurella spumae]|uniref:PucR family transcriptional regulator n=1 Tax=Tsukamurella spumae TaxID=44753 RepID=A0A846X9R1_9ACTN|nr:helix-turn-helix domain-containing protein [Tsukamurella spumae]NKY20972.1 PucR family transcriptional regulator [Tsukamurella spumae]
MRQTSDRSGYGSDPIGRTVAGVLGGLDQRIVGDRMTARMLADIPELRGDVELERALAASVAGNVETVLHGMVFGVDPGTIVAPLAALAYPRLLAQRGLPVTALVRAYRLGQASMVQQMHAAVRATDLPLAQMLAAHEWITDWSFSYSDTVIETVIAAYQRERDRWMQGRSSARVARVRELLAGDDTPDIDAASSAVGYPLRRHHLAVIAWFPDDEAGAAGGGDLVDRMESFVRALAEAVGVAEAPLFIAADHRTAWGWLPLAAAEPGSARAHAFLTAPPDGARSVTAGLGDGAPRVAVGTVRTGVDGFRRSHREAEAVRRTVGEGSAVFAGDPGVMVAALVGADPAAARAWARDVLGDLAADTESDARLRATLAVYLRHGGGFKAAAEELNMHANSVKYRVQRAIARRGRAIGDDRLDIEVALLVRDPAGERARAGH